MLMKYLKRVEGRMVWNRTLREEREEEVEGEGRDWKRQGGGGGVVGGGGEQVPEERTVEGEEVSNGGEGEALAWNQPQVRSLWWELAPHG